MRICFLTLRRSRKDLGWEPDCPDGASFLLLADAPKSRWGIYEVSWDDEMAQWSPDLVDPQLRALVASGMRFPPAMALARDEMTRRFAKRDPDRGEFVSAYAAAIRAHLTDQSQTRFVLARAVRSGLIDLAEGEWYWVVRVSGSPPMASWVSSDYFVYQTAAANFDLSLDQKRRLQGEGAA